MHFPLHKGAEVLLTFVDGDPDRPVISSSIPNPETTSPVTAENQTKSIIRDNYGNEMIFDSTPGDEHIRLHSPHHNSRLLLGKCWGAVSATDHFDWHGGTQVELGLGNKYEAFAGTAAEVFAGMSVEAKLGLAAEVEVAGKGAFLLGPDAGVHIGPELKCHFGPTHERNIDSDASSCSGRNSIISAQEVLNLVGGAGSPGAEGSSSVIEAHSDKLVLSVGDNKNPEGSLPTKVKVFKILSALVAILSPITLATWAGFEFVNEFVFQKDQNDPEDAAAVTASYSGLQGVIATLFPIIIGLLSLGDREKINLVSHSDAPGEKPDSFMKLESKGGLVMGVGEQDSGKEDARIELNKKDATPYLNLASGKTWVHLDKDGDLKIISNGNLEQEAEKKVQVLGTNQVQIESFGEIQFNAKRVSASKGIFETKNIIDLG